MRLYHLLPEIVRKRDLAASGFPIEAPDKPVGAGGAPAESVGNRAVYNARLGASIELPMYRRVYIVCQVGTDPAERFALLIAPGVRDVEFDIAPVAGPSGAPYRLQLAVYEDRKEETLLFAADTDDDLTGWFWRPQPILERIMSVFERQAQEAEKEIEGLADLIDLEVMPQDARVLISDALGALLNEEWTEEFQRFFTGNLVSFHKLRGTTPSLKYLIRWVLGQELRLVELYKNTFPETGDYARDFDAGHQIKSARYDTLTDCASGCETGAEIPALGGQAAREMDALLETVLPVHVKRRIPLIENEFLDVWENTDETFGPVAATASFLDTWNETRETLLVSRTCISTAQTGCFSCCQTSCTSCEAFTCESDTCQIGCTTSCTITGEVGCTFSTEGGGGGGGGCDLKLELIKINCIIGCEVSGCQLMKELPPPKKKNDDPPSVRDNYFVMAVPKTDPETGGVNIKFQLGTTSSVASALQSSGYLVLTDGRFGDIDSFANGSTFGQGGVTQGLPTSATGEPCSSCPASVVANAVSDAGTFAVQSN